MAISKWRTVPISSVFPTTGVERRASSTIPVGFAGESLRRAEVVDLSQGFVDFHVELRRLGAQLEPIGLGTPVEKGSIQSLNGHLRDERLNVHQHSSVVRGARP
jgi:hypothetical protein